MTRALLLGGDLATFAAALDLAEVGVEVWMAAAEPALPTRPVRDPGGEIRALLVGLSVPETVDAPALREAEPRELAAPETALRARDGAWKPQPVPAVWGIPTVPLSSACIGMLGLGGALRAYLDRVKPVLTIGQEANLAKLVDSRLGQRARRMLVEPLVYERFGVGAAEAEVALVEPGLNGALTRAGSLSGGALLHLDEYVARETIVTPRVGWEEFAALVASRLRLYGARQFPGHVKSCVPSAGEHDAPAARGARWIVTDDTGATHVFDAVLGDPASLSVCSGPLDQGAGDTEGSGGASLAELLRPVREQPVRDHVRVSLPSDAAPGAAAAGALTSDRLALVTDADGRPWAARVSWGSGGELELRLSGPVPEAARQQAPPVAEACAALGLEVADVALAEGEARTEQRVAPWARAAERDALDAARAALAAAFPTLVLAGAAAHGDQLGAALGEARELAVQLRRKLTGISE